MSARKSKKSSMSSLRELHDSIMNLLVKIKPKLENVGTPSDSLLEDLFHVAALAESFTEQRPKSNRDWIDLADSLDREGVALWNGSGHVREGSQGTIQGVIAALKYAGYRLIQAGLEQKPGIETLIHVLQLASKTGSALLEAGKRDAAASVLGCAAKFEESLKSAKDPEGLYQQARTRATFLYYSSRMEAAWREGNEGVAQFMLQKLTENEALLALLRACDRERLAAKVLEIGKGMLRSTPRGDAGTTVDGMKAQESVRWMRKAFTLIEQLEDSASPGLSELKRSILRSLARAYFLASTHDPENLNRAEASLQELITSIDASAEHATSEYQQLRWMRLAVLKRQRASDSTLLESLKSIIDHINFGETTVTDILQELRTLAQQHALVTAVHQYCLRHALGSPDGSPFIDRLLFSLVHHTSKDEVHSRAMSDLETAFSYLHEAGFELPKVSATACLTLLWQFGDRQYQAKRWPDAAGWFLLGTHKVFTNLAPLSHGKCYRKAALCHIQQREYAKAHAVIRRCPVSEASTFYVVFLTAVHQGLEDEAVRAVSDMVKSADFDRKMLLLATQVAHESDLKNVLLSVLEALLKTIHEEAIDAEIEAMTITRCTVRLVLKLLAEPLATKRVLVDVMVRHFRTARSMCEVATSRNRAAVIIKDISWLWRTAYNCAVQGCSEWENAEDQVSDLFDVSRELLELYCQSTLLDLDPEAYLTMIHASFAAIVGRVYTLRQATDNGSPREDQLRPIAAEITARKARILDILDKHKIQANYDVDRVRSFLRILLIFETEILCQLKEWKGVAKIVTDVTTSDLAIITFEAIADILWVEQDCPVDVLYTTLEAILHTSLERDALSVQKFSRWLRAIVTILLSRNAPLDRTKAIGYVEQATTVLDDSGSDNHDETYPMDERQWLLGTAYNTGIECLHASLLDEAKRWFEASTVICRFVVDGQRRAEKISETYSQLLARYAPSSN